jgi:hypothetical protein
MKNLFAIAAAVAALSVVSVDSASALTPEGDQCVIRNGYQPSQWQARAVPAGPPASRIHACLAKLRADRATRAK